MRLSRLYSNRPTIFEPIDFVDGLNVVLAEIRLPENRNKDTHNLGKTILGRLIDFCLLSDWRKTLFLHKFRPRFEGFVFFLELRLLDGTWLTLRRGVDEPSKVSFKRHSAPTQDFTQLPGVEWDHLNQPFERAIDLLDGILDLRSLATWPYRKVLGYCVRSQDDYSDVFQLARFGNHVDWKPFLAHLFGFNGELIRSYYDKAEELVKKEHEEASLRARLGGAPIHPSKIDGMILLRQNEVDKKQASIDAFDFRAIDKEHVDRLVNQIDTRLAELGRERYHLTSARRRITTALKAEHIAFDPEGVAQLFAEAGVIFPGQLTKDFTQLIAFNREISEERGSYLAEELKEVEERLRAVTTEMNALNSRRAGNLSFLVGADVFGKYKQITAEIVELRANIIELERRRTLLQTLHDLKVEIRTIADEKQALLTAVEENVREQSKNTASRFSRMRLFFSEIVDEVISSNALLSVEINKDGYLDFSAEFLDDTGGVTGASLGHTYKKLLCIAFDMALARSYLEEKYPRFLFHDGIFENLDDRKKRNLLDLLRQYAEIGIQSLITLIDADMPPRVDQEEPVLSEDEIVVLLHDEGESGLLFKMPPW